MRVLFSLVINIFQPVSEIVSLRHCRNSHVKHESCTSYSNRYTHKEWRDRWVVVVETENIIAW